MASSPHSYLEHLAQPQPLPLQPLHHYVLHSTDYYWQTTTWYLRASNRRIWSCASQSIVGGLHIYPASTAALTVMRTSHDEEDGGCWYQVHCPIVTFWRSPMTRLARSLNQVELGGDPRTCICVLLVFKYSPGSIYLINLRGLKLIIIASVLSWERCLKVKGGGAMVFQMVDPTMVPHPPVSQIQQSWRWWWCWCW